MIFNHRDGARVNAIGVFKGTDDPTQMIRLASTWRSSISFDTAIPDECRVVNGETGCVDSYRWTGNIKYGSKKEYAKGTYESLDEYEFEYAGSTRNMLNMGWIEELLEKP